MKANLDPLSNNARASERKLILQFGSDGAFVEGI